MHSSPKDQKILGHAVLWYAMVPWFTNDVPCQSQKPSLYMGVSENVVYPIVPNGFADHYPVFKWLAIIGNINPTFSDKPISLFLLLDFRRFTLWWTYKKLLNMAIEIVDFPSKNGDFPWLSCYVSSPEGKPLKPLVLRRSSRRPRELPWSCLAVGWRRRLQAESTRCLVVWPWNHRKTIGKP